MGGGEGEGEKEDGGTGSRMGEVLFLCGNLSERVSYRTPTKNEKKTHTRSDDRVGFFGFLSWRFTCCRISRTDNKDTHAEKKKKKKSTTPFERRKKTGTSNTHIGKSQT